MADREKVIKGLHQHCEGSLFDKCGECTYYVISDEQFSCRDRLLEDVLIMLKEQEPVEPSIDLDAYVCSNCGHRLEVQSMLGDNVIFDERYNFCPACGQAVKWNDSD